MKRHMEPRPTEPGAPPGSPSTESSDCRPRAVVYSLLARLLAEPPGEDLLQRLRAIPGQDIESYLGTAWIDLRDAAFETDAECVREEYRLLFEGLSAGEVIPYASWHLTGQLMDRPLATLRTDLAHMDCRRLDGVHEPEDHAAALCEVMALICMDPAPDLEPQSRFFHRHLNPWMASFFRDLISAPSARFYRAVGRFGERFLAVESAFLPLEEGDGHTALEKEEAL